MNSLEDSPEMTAMSSAELELLRTISEGLKELTQRFDAWEQNALMSRSRMHQEIDTLSKEVNSLGHRVTAAEKSIEAAAPQLRRWNDLQAKIAAGGWISDKLWRVGVILFTLAGWIVAMRDQIGHWLQMLFWPPR